MVLSTRKSSFPLRLLPFLALALVALSGCGGKVPVTGKITVDDKPIASGGVTFHPDKEKGNTGTDTPIGQIKDGTYELFTNGKAGADPGWYKVVVAAVAPSDSSGDPTTDAKKLYAAPQSLVAAKYNSEKTTDLLIEVKTGGAFDLKLSGPGKTGTPGAPPMPGVPMPGAPPMPR